MKYHRNIRNKINKLQEDIVKLEKDIENATNNNKIFFAKRLRMMSDKKREQINTMLSIDD